MRCAVQNSKLWVCIIGSLSVFLPKQSSRLTAQSDSRALNQVEYLSLASSGFPDTILYRSKHISAVSNPTKFGPRRGRIAVRSVLKWRHPQLLSTLNTALAKS